MKRSVSIFLFLVLLPLLAIPAFNIFTASSRGAIHLYEKSFLYNMDFISRLTARLLYPLGVSTDPKQVIIGRDGWLYLGDEYQQTLSDDRRAATETDIAEGKQIGDATEAWNAYLTGKGVKLFRIMIGPNKGTIYPEYMPPWARPNSFNPTDALLAGTTGERYIDLRTALLAAKKTHREALYYKTDTHWNLSGAGVAFHAFAQQVGKAAPDLKWPSDNAYELEEISSRNGGDLASFLRLNGSLFDFSPTIHASTLHIETTRYDFETKKLLQQGGNPVVDTPTKPVLVRSAGALNDKKVLWLRDSYGNAMSPLMAATFKEVVQLHWNVAIQPGGTFTQLIDEWKPDYVFVTVVERAARTPWFAAYPPPSLMEKDKSFSPVQTAKPVAVNQLLQGPSENEYQINGSDAFVDFELSDSVTIKNTQFLNIDLACADGSSTVPMQLFWLEDGKPYFDEVHSVSFPFRTGQTLIDLRTIQKWPTTTSVKRVRVDIDAVHSCVHFKLNTPNFGVRS